MDGLLEMENKDASENTASQLTFKPWRVFINHVDSYHGKKLTDFLLAQSYCHTVNTMHLNENIPMGQGEVKDIQVLDSTLTTTTTTTMMPFEKLELKNYEIIGTVINDKHEVPESVRIVEVDNQEIFLHELMCCGFVIYDITLDDNQIAQARWCVKAIAEELENVSKSNDSSSDENTKDIRFFMLISNIMTWAQTKSLDPKNPRAPFTEADYAKRIAHENFMHHMHCENDVLMIKKHYNVSLNFKTLVLCCGITYGDEQGPLNFLFEMACDSSRPLTILGDGTNKIPLLHVTQFVTTVHSLLHCWPEQVPYLVATELDLISQATIVKKINAAFSCGEIKQLAINESNEFKNIGTRDYNIITVDVNIEPAYTLDKCIQSNVTFEMNFNNVEKEYRIFHNLLPIKIVVHGPPAVGKTILSKLLADYYCISYVDGKSLITETIQNLTLSIERMTHVEGVEQADVNNMVSDVIDDQLSILDHESCVTKREQLQDQLNDIRNNLMKNDGHLDEHVLNKIILKHLTSKKCLNQGYVMDGYPKTSAHADDLFGASISINHTKNDDIDWTKKNDRELVNIMPQLVIVLEASDQLLLNRVIHLPERETQRANHNVESMLRRLRKYRKHNVDDNANVVNFFAANNVPILIVPIEEAYPEMHSAFQRCVETIGRPQNSGPITLEIAAVNHMTARTGIGPIATSSASHIRKEEQIFEEQRKQEEIILEWTHHLHKILQDEENILQQLSEPLRLYLVIHVFPTLTQGLIEVARTRPDDPVDFLMAYDGVRSLSFSSASPDERIIIDIIGFHDNNGDLIPKEVAITSLDHDYFEHHIVSAPFWLHCLKKERRDHCKCEELKHGLNWVMRGISIEDLQRRLKHLTRLASKVYTFGLNVTRCVRELTHVAPTDIIRHQRDLSTIPYSDTYCMYHGMEWRGRFACALNNVSRIKAWLRSPHGEDYKLARADPIYVLMKPLDIPRPTHPYGKEKESELSEKSVKRGTSGRNT